MLTIAGGIVIAFIFIIVGIVAISALAEAIFHRWFWVSAFYLLATACLLLGANPGGKSIDGFIVAAFFFGIIATVILCHKITPSPLIYVPPVTASHTPHERERPDYAEVDGLDDLTDVEV